MQPSEGQEQRHTTWPVGVDTDVETALWGLWTVPCVGLCPQGLARLHCGPLLVDLSKGCALVFLVCRADWGGEELLWTLGMSLEELLLDL